MNLTERRKELNPLQKGLREALRTNVNPQEVIHRFLLLHAILHSKRVVPNSRWSYEDLLLDDLSEERFRWIPEGGEHSVVWIVWHLSRIEDVTMNLLVAGRDQVFERGDWLKKTGSPIKHTGNGTGLDVAKSLSERVDLAALREYRYAVGRSTREIVSNLTQADFTRKMEMARLQRIIDEGPVVQPGFGVVDYWGRRDVAGLLLMPPTRHTIIHWNEVYKIIRQMN